MDTCSQDDYKKSLKDEKNMFANKRTSRSAADPNDTDLYPSGKAVSRIG